MPISIPPGRKSRLPRRSSGRVSTPRPVPVTATTSTASGAPSDGARVVMRWKIFDGFANTANVREQKQRERGACPPVRADPRGEEDVRSAWSRLTNQTAGRRARDPGPRVGRPAALLSRAVQRRPPLAARRADAQNTRYVQASAETARMARLYAQYRVLAASNRLIEALGVQMPAEAVMNQRATSSASIRSRRKTGRRTASRIRSWVRRRRTRRWHHGGRAPRSHGRPVIGMKGTGVEYHALAGFRRRVKLTLSSTA